MELSDAAAETSGEMHRHSRGQLRHGTAMTAEEKRRQSKERPYADLQRLGKAERWQGYVRRGLVALRKGTDPPCKAKERPGAATSSNGKARRCSAKRRNGKASKHYAMGLQSEAQHWICNASRCGGKATQSPAMRVDAVEEQSKAQRRRCTARTRMENNILEV